MILALYALAAACSVLAPCALRMASHFARAGDVHTFGGGAEASTAVRCIALP